MPVEDGGAIHFIINGKVVARLDAAGLRIRESIDYGGMLASYGTGGFDGRLGWKEYQSRKAEARDEP